MEHYIDKNGAILSKDKKTLIHAPNVASYEIPDGVITIEHHAFAEHKKIKQITVPPSVKYINVWAFKNCSNLETIILPHPIPQIEWSAFWGCDKLHTISNLWCLILQIIIEHENTIVEYIMMEEGLDFPDFPDLQKKLNINRGYSK